MAIVVVPLTLTFVAILSSSDEADAHGSLESPPSRIYQCRFAENPENPTSTACRAAIDASGVQAVYDWNEVNQPTAGGNHRAIIPDGRLCSAGRDKYRGFDLPRADWPATAMTSGAWHHFQLLGTTAHVGTVELYITRDGYDPTRPLSWSDLETTPFLAVTRTAYPADYSASAQLPPGKTGRHLIYMIWQRSDSPEAFYSCSDVDFGDTGAIARPPSTDDTTGPGPTNTPTVTVPTAAVHSEHPHDREGPTVDGAGAPADSAATAWSAGTAYGVGALVTYEGRVYRCRQAHVSLIGWEPAITAALWTGVAGTSSGETASWQPNTAYATGQLVSHNGRRYRCLQGHTALAGWEPENTPALWQPVS